jgi:succinyl-CoA synthetase beta subunit
MNFVESAAKPLLAEAGIPVPRSYVVNTMAGVEQAAKLLGGPCVVKAQVPVGGRGKAGGIKLANNVVAAKKHAERILGMTIGGHKVERLLIEETVPIAAEMYAAVLNDPISKCPLLLFSGKGGMDVEDIAAKHPGALMRLPVDILKGPNEADILAALPPNLPINPRVAATLLMRLYDIYLKHDAELLEVNPLVLTRPGGLAALDCKFVLDDSAVPRRPVLAAKGAPEQRTALEVKAEALGLKFIELDGNVGVLANGAGLTMTTMDAIRHYGGTPANFLEIGGESYTKAKPALELVLANPSVKALLVNFCGAFARTDVMTEGVIAAWLELAPKIPVFFSIHGTGEDEAIALVRSRLGIEPYDVMDDAVKAAVAAVLA